jgi:hypothetical protein
MINCPAPIAASLGLKTVGPADSLQLVVFSGLVFCLSNVPGIPKYRYKYLENTPASTNGGIKDLCICGGLLFVEDKWRIPRTHWKQQ